MPEQTNSSSPATATAAAAPGRVKKACTECRQQKAKCDAHVHQPCTRCRKVKATCTISEPFKRENKRQKLHDLRHETQELRERLQSLGAGEDGDLSTSPARASARAGYASSVGFVDESSDGRNIRRGVQPVETNASLTSPRRNDSVLNGPTQSRSLGGILLDADKIDELFELYFSEFAPYLPFLDSTKSPNAYYELSAFLFWSILGVACRASNTPGLINTLKDPIGHMAFDSLKQNPGLEQIQALILIVAWPFPKSTGIWNPTFALTGALIHMAMGIGMHVPVSSQEFYKFRLRLDPEEVKQRAELWSYCVTMYQRSCICKGNSTLMLTDFCQEPKQRQMLFDRLDPPLTFHLRLQDMVSRACRAFAENGLQDMSLDQERSLNILIKMYQSQIQEFHGTASTLLDELDVLSASLTVQVFHLFKAHSPHESESITGLFMAACQVLEKFDKFSQSGRNGLRAAPFHYLHTLQLAAHTLLRLFKVPSFSSFLDEARAKAMVYLAISLTKQMVVEQSDLAARSVKALTQLVESKRAFQNPSGNLSPVPLRVKTRMAMGIMLDGLIWWREEFGGTMGLYPIPLTKSSDTRGMTQIQDIASVQNVDDGVAVEHQTYDPSLESLFWEQSWTGFEDWLSPSSFAPAMWDGMPALNSV